ncbi:MAG: DEAD/DEAH box helicase [Treponema sp.]|jgi:ATP-dependent Lhr-like helicase|nr:DEAD/DEAH box helicase [Treponema sp.]
MNRGANIKFSEGKKQSKAESVKNDPFERLAPFIREYIYSEKWSALRDIQRSAINAIFDGREHLLIAAGTAAGKTEAVFFPVISLLASFPRGASSGVSPEDLSGSPPARPLVLYISPLKALINDQFARLGSIIEHGGLEEDVRLWRWHGDVPSDHKKKFLQNPGGILQITPESLEALLLRHARRMKGIFGSLIFAVIDEVHAFMESDRGAQVLCQLARIEEAAGIGGQVRRIGLSATLGDYEGAASWLALGTDRKTALLGGGRGGRKISIALDCFWERALIPGKDGAAEARRRQMEALYEQCRDKRAIIFANSRLEAEESAAALKKIAARRGERDIFFVHHGSVSSLDRSEAEAGLKSKEGPAVSAATATLELGIDIGELDRIIQIGPPWSVSAFVQRLGRSGRRSGRAEMYFTMTEEHSRTGIPWKLLRTMAVIELYIREQWIEPPDEKPLPYSLLLHQTLAVLASLGEHSAAALRKRMLSLPPFLTIAVEDISLLLDYMERCGLVQKTEEGNVILGLEGERIVNRHSFYPVFPGEDQYRVIQEGREVGTVNFVPPPGSVIAVGGINRLVTGIDGLRREIRVIVSEAGGGGKLWRGGGGGIHRRVSAAVKIMLEEETVPPYLTAPAKEALEGGRRSARTLGLLEKPVVPAEGAFLIAPWQGSAGLRTLETLLKRGETRKALRISYLDWEGDFVLRAETGAPPAEFTAGLAAACERALRSPPPLPDPIPYTDKYDHLLPQALLEKQYAANMLDIGALGELRERLIPAQGGPCGVCETNAASKA